MERGITPQSRRILRWPAVHNLNGKSRVQTWRDERAGKFPRRIRLGPNSVGWDEAEVLAWLEALPRGPGAAKAIAARRDLKAAP